jgi:signal transduction histidine kinase
MLGSSCDAAARPPETGRAGAGEHRPEGSVALVTSWAGYAGLVLVVSCAHILLQLYCALGRSAEGLRCANDELQASRARIVAAADAERRRIERDLHDGAQQQLTSLAVKLLLATALAGPDPALTGLLEDLGAELKDTAQELRNLVHGIYPPLLRQNGLAAALSDAARLSTLPTTVRATPVGRYPADIEAAVYFCCLEALQNAGKHAGQRATIRLRVREEPGTLTFEVIDDGAGFDPRSRGLGAGLGNMADRMAAFGGRLQVQSAPGRGTRITGTIPVPTAPSPQVSSAAGQRGEHVGEDGVGPGVQLAVGQQLDRMGDVDHAGARHAEPACLLDGFVGERCRRDADRRDAPALEMDEVMQTARRA